MPAPVYIVIIAVPVESVFAVPNFLVSFPLEAENSTDAFSRAMISRSLRNVSRAERRAESSEVHRYVNSRPGEISEGSAEIESEGS